MSYFLKIYYLTKEQLFLDYRNFRSNLFDVGDILSLFFRGDNLSFFFEGLCVAIKKKGSPNFSFLLHNVLSGVAIEFNLSFFYNRAFFFKINNFKRKQFFYTHSKLYYLKSNETKTIIVK